MEDQGNVQTIVTAAARAMGTQLSDPVDLGGSGRSTVLRCTLPDGETVVVKAYRPGEEQRTSFAREASALKFCDRGPRLLAEDPDALLVVMSDLGSAPSLADALLGDDADTAQDALIQWAVGYADLAAGSIGRRPEWDAALARRAPRGEIPDDATWIAKSMTDFPRLLELAASPVPRGLEDELGGIGALSSPGDRYLVFSPGDICPDNNMITAAGLRMLDFEGAGFHSVFHDAAYTRMPFSSCWCVYRLPEPIGARVEAAYRRRVVEALPELADDGFWAGSLRAATAMWTIHAAGYLLDRALEGDRPLHGRNEAAPTIRQLLRYRWEKLCGELEEAGELPALSEALRGLLKVTEAWKVEPLPIYPAFV